MIYIRIPQIHEEIGSTPGDILVFLTGQEEIEAMVRQIKLIAGEATYENGSKSLKLSVIPLFATQQPAAQEKVFTPTKPGFRKIIVATNVAETSITIPGVRYVVDCCRVKAKVYQPSTGIDVLKTVLVSQAQAWQRTGRAGREGEGHCYRMLTKEKFQKLPKTTVPEVLRCNLSSVILQLLTVGVKDVEKFDFLERPPNDSLHCAMRLLKLLGAVGGGGVDDVNLTDLGKKMSAFPIAPQFAKAILNAKDLGCTEEVVTIVAILSGESILVTPVAKREEALAARKKFASSEGDHITYLKIFRAFKSAQDQREWCLQNFVNLRQMRFAVEVRKQLMELCRKEDIPVQSAGNQTEPVRKALAQGLFTNVARLTREGTYVTVIYT